MRHGARRDGNEAGIVKALRAAGALVYQLDARNLPDLLVGHRRTWHVLEVKQPHGPRGGDSHRKLTPGQATFFLLSEQMELPVSVVRTPEEALRAIGAIDC